MYWNMIDYRLRDLVHYAGSVQFTNVSQIDRISNYFVRKGLQCEYRLHEIPLARSVTGSHHTHHTHTIHTPHTHTHTHCMLNASVQTTAHVRKVKLCRI
jgi:hypothetical protein